jgi:hypothetical protein
MKQLFIIFAISVLLLTTCLAQSEKVSSTIPANKQKIIPIADYNPSEIKNPEEDQLRKLRNSKFDMDKSLHTAETINQFRLSEKSFENQFVATIFSPEKVRAALPVSRSKLIVIAEIVEGKAYLSNDKTAVYSEFTLKIEEVLKQGSDLYVAKNGNLAILRRAGGIRFPSGKVYYRTFEDYYALPEVGGRYLMFLYEDKATKSFVELAGYKFQSGEVLPLDGTTENKVNEHFREFYKYKGYREKDFIDIVKKEITNVK